jgi:hypothetical protein
MFCLAGLIGLHSPDRECSRDERFVCVAAPVHYALVVPFSVAQKTLERLEWSQVLARLAEHARTPKALSRLQPADGKEVATGLFEPTEEGVRDRLTETAEARTILAEGDAPPLAELVDVSGALARARKGGALTARELLDVARAFATVRGSPAHSPPSAGCIAS